MRRPITAALASVLVAAGVLRSHFVPLCILVLMGALVGLLIATQTEESRDVLRVPAMVVVTVLAIVGVGQLGPTGILLGVALLLVAAPHRRRTGHGPR